MEPAIEIATTARLFGHKSATIMEFCWNGHGVLLEPLWSFAGTACVPSYKRNGDLDRGRCWNHAVGELQPRSYFAGTVPASSCEPATPTAASCIDGSRELDLCTGCYNGVCGVPCPRDATTVTTTRWSLNNGDGASAEAASCIDGRRELDLFARPGCYNGVCGVLEPFPCDATTVTTTNWSLNNGDGASVVAVSYEQRRWRTPTPTARPATCAGGWTRKMTGATGEGGGGGRFSGRA